ncbi:beta-galactosidase isoform X2 [Aplysia californica]|uniref:Beta-galactosidase n=1 Tax=Aplysia californica TaxID=6500 RepID=A0ABM0K1S3_APLCA|nr:beta-galactosidase isoform X2 [Aplysia californica]
MIEKMATTITITFIIQLVVAVGLLFPGSFQLENKRKFEIDYANNTFLKDGQPFRYISGSFHYSRVHPYYWKDRLMKMRAGGLNTVQGYVPWNVHETKPGEFYWDGFSDLPKFLSLAQESDMLVLLRLGPYICGEWEYGGFPAWLLSKDSNMILRTSDPSYMKWVDKWFTELLTTIKPFLYNNGGPVIMVQIENEYGSYFACDRSYGVMLRDKVTSILGNEVVIYTTDGCNLRDVFCGKVDQVYPSIDFGADLDPSSCFQALRFYQPKGPLINSEYYTGWLDHWGSPHSTRGTTQVSKSLDKILALDANVNMYMFIGGTNFGFWNGANYKPYQPVPTSYDYDAPLTEAGDVTLKYYAIRDIISKYVKLPPIPIPPNTNKTKYGKIPMEFVSTVQDALHVLTPEGPFKYSGFILYRSILTEDYKKPVTLNIHSVRDRAMVMVNSVPFGILDREGASSVSIKGLKGQTVDILVENQGRIGFGYGMNFNLKGIISNVTVGDKVVTNWQIYPLHIENINQTVVSRMKSRSSQRQPFSSADSKLTTPSIYVGTVDIASPNQPTDTFLDPRPWGKGQAIVNNFNLGRYWPSRGPQVTLYVPKPVFNSHTSQNQLFLFELERAPCSTASNCSVTFTDVPYLDGPNKPDNKKDLPSLGYTGHNQH